MDYTALLKLRFSQVALFSGLSEKEMDVLRREAVIRKFQEREVVAREGDKPDFFMVLLSGSVDICRTTFGGETIVYRRLYPPVVFGYSLLAAKPYSADIIVAETLMAAIIPLSVVKRILIDNPEAIFTALNHLSSVVSSLSTENQELRTLSLKERVMRVLERICDNNGNCRVSHEELANMAGGTRANTSRALKNLEISGYLELRRRLISLKKYGAEGQD
ncbi:MAG: hypothetical protein DRZ90_10430 [Spirochaetes bacterium]|nr:MAG: hypothetical protein DRZ90_10430 [Spirochaetota bacterium]